VQSTTIGKDKMWMVQLVSGSKLTECQWMQLTFLSQFCTEQSAKNILQFKGIKLVAVNLQKSIKFVNVILL